MAGEGCREARAAAVGAGLPAQGPVCQREAAHLIGCRALHGPGENFRERALEAAIQLAATHFIKKDSTVDGKVWWFL